MRTFFSCFVVAATVFGFSHTADAGELSVKIANGRATIIARDVPVRQILAEWARVGDTKVVNGDKLPGGPVTLELVDVPEKEALDILLRTAAGYIAAPRPANASGASQFDRVLVLATSRPPATPPSVAPQPFGRAVMQQPMPPQPPPDDDDGEPQDQGPMPPPVIGPNGPMQPFPGANGPAGAEGPMNVPGSANAPAANQPITAPRPGIIPMQPQPGVPPNPYAPQPRPGAGVQRPAGESDDQ